MNKLSSLILLLAAPLAACSHHASDDDTSNTALDAGEGGVPSGNLDAFGSPAGPDLTCLNQPTPASSATPNPMLLAGQVVEYTTAGVTPVDAADIALFRAGQPVVLARTHSATNGAFATGSFATNGHAIHAYVKATKRDYRTAFFYPPSPFAANSTTLVVPTISDAQFATLTTLLGATQDDAHNGALVVAVLDCAGHPLLGATVTVRRGQSTVGHSHDLGTAIPALAGATLVLDVPDGMVRVSATYQNNQLPEHDVAVRAKDPECATAKGTLTSTIVIPSA